MRVGVLGPLVVRRGDGSAVRVPGVKVRALLVALLVRGGRPASADLLVDDIWEERPPSNPAGALQAKVSQLRAVLDDAEPGGRGRLVSASLGYALRVDPDTLDIDRFDTLAGHARAAPDLRTRVSLLSEALGLWRGDAFGEFADAPFVRSHVTALEERRLVVVEELAEARLERGEHALLAGELGDVVARHPLRERLRAAHLRALYGAGRQSEALAGYRELRDLLAGEQGLDPGPDLVGLHQAILNQDPALEHDAPAGPGGAGTPPEPPHSNLPGRLTELIGRDDAVQRVHARLASDRLVTLTGPGGVGKTRLALEVGARVADDGSRVCLVELAALGRPDDPPGYGDVVEAVAAATGRYDEREGGPTTGPHEQTVRGLTTALAARPTLLLLDNCEHVLEPVAVLVRELLGATTTLQVLTTGREPTGIAGERVVVVEPLALPGPDGDGADPTEVARWSAVRMFAERAARADPGFELGPDNAADVLAVCRRLDGLPLALELAATRVRGLGVRELAARLDDRFRLLDAEQRGGVAARQQTLRNVIGWSWELLTDDERILLRRMAVHADGCVLDAAEAVCAGGELDRADVATLLGRLVDRSLVTVTTARGVRRYRMLETVAAYCRERLESSGEADEVTGRHGEHYTALAEHAAPRLRGHDQREWLERLDAETANMNRALDTAVQAGDAARALRLVDGLAWYWFLRGRLHVAARALDRALDVPGSAPAALTERVRTWRAGWSALLGRTAAQASPDRPGAEAVDDPEGRAFGEWFLGRCLEGGGDLAAAEELVGSALRRFRTLGHRWGIAAALGSRASHGLVRGDIAGSRRDGEQGLALFVAEGDRWGQCTVTGSLAAVAEISGDYDEAARLHRDGLRHAEDLALWPEVGARWARLGRIALLAGDHPRAHDFHERARRLAAELGQGAAETFAETGLAIGARAVGDLDAAETHIRHALSWNLRAGYQPGLAQCWAELGLLAELRGDAEGARRLHLDGLAVADGAGDPRAVAFAVEGLAGARALAGEHDEAARLLGAAAAIRTATGAPLPEAERGGVDRVEATVRAAVGDDGFGAAFARGRTDPPTAGELLADAGPAGPGVDGADRRHGSRHHDADATGPSPGR